MSIIECLNSIKDSIPKIQKENKTQLWKSDKLKTLVEERATLNVGSKRGKDRQKHIQKQIRQEVKHLRNKYLKEQSDDINEARMNRQNVKMWLEMQESMVG